MAKFTFPLPGRKRQQIPKMTMIGPMTKEHEMLVSGPLTVDARSPKHGANSWEGISDSGISITVSDSTSPNYDGLRFELPTIQPGAPLSTRDWGDESEILPSHYKMSAASEDVEDGHSNFSGIIRERQSFSTIKSFYDKSKQPLSVSQQTSASAMAKGLPSKAQRMLDMDNSVSGPPARPKKKPARLDLSNLMSSQNRASHLDADGQDNWNGFVLGPEYAMRSPSILSQLTPPPGQTREPRRLQKRSTKESLRAAQAAHAQAAQASHAQAAQAAEAAPPGSPRRGSTYPNGVVPDLYEHYEQMSLRQIMDLEPHHVESPVDAHLEAARNARVDSGAVRQTQSQRDMRQLNRAHGHHDTQLPANANMRLGPSSPTGSAFSRATRTSRASKASNGFLDTNLQGKSVLSLSSDSDDEDCGDLPMKTPASVPTRRRSDTEDLAPTQEAVRPQTSQALNRSDTRSSKSSKSSKRTTFAPFHTYFPPPKRPGSGAPSISSQGTSPSMSTFHIPSSPSRISTASNVSTMSGSASYSNAGYGVQEARAVTMVQAEGPLGKEARPETELESETSAAGCAARASLHRGPANTSADQPTPPMSPTSADFYIDFASSPASSRGGQGQNRFMAVTREEEMLLAALRHKQQFMREADAPTPAESRQPQPKGHHSKASDATITQALFDFDFPAAPSPAREDTSISSSSSSMVEGTVPGSGNNPWAHDPFSRSNGSFGGALSPTPVQSKRKKGILKTPKQAPRGSDRHKHPLTYLERPISPGTQFEIDEAEPQPDLNDFIDFDDESSRASIMSSGINLSEFPQAPRTKSLNDLAVVRRSSSSKYRQHYQMTAASRDSLLPLGEELDEALEEALDEEESAGTPRPDSPISAESFPSPPSSQSMINKKTARLSAVGPSRLGGEPGWWGDDD